MVQLSKLTPFLICASIFACDGGSAPEAEHRVKGDTASNSAEVSVSDLSLEPSASSGRQNKNFFEEKAGPPAPRKKRRVSISRPSLPGSPAHSQANDMDEAVKESSVASGGGSMKWQTKTLRAPIASAPIAKAPMVKPPAADKNAWFQNTYQGGVGDRESLAKAVEAGVVLDGKRVTLDAFSGAYQQDYPFPSEGALGMTLRSDRAKPLEQGGTITLEVGLKAAGRELGERPNLDIVLVMDISGSMVEENKIDALKGAAIEVISRLGAGDHLGLVTYSSGAAVLSPLGAVTDKAALTQAVADIHPGGGTNIHQGLTLGYGQIEAQGRPDASPLVILLSDGKVTSGVNSPGAFTTLTGEAAKKDIITSAIGMGVSYDETLMMSLSQSGGGNYHFIGEPEDVRGVVEREIEELSEALARAVRLRIVLPDGVELVRVLGSKQLSKAEARAVKAEEARIDATLAEEMGIKQDRQKQDEPGIKMLIPAFKSNDDHVVLMELSLPPGQGSLDIAEVHLTYKDMLSRSNRELEDTLKLTYAKDKKESVASIDQRVKKNIMGFMTGEALMAAAEELERGQSAAALRTIDDQMTLLGVAAKQWRDDDLRADAELLGQYKEVLRRQGQGGSSRALAGYISKSLSYSAFQRLN